ncbi:unnamed protein product [Closterium sp. NIES-65]|nr:unnamed protein product [Closterium sp. NIES-65]CAI5939785.1 unnamed protein product [Closterium sp. NIES-65]
MTMAHYYASAGESERENEEEEAREEGWEGASESGRDDRSDLDSAEGAEEAEWADGAEEGEWAEGAEEAEWAEGTGKADRAERAELSASADGGYACRGWDNETEMAMLAKSVAEEGVAERGVAERGIAEEAKGPHWGESWVSSVEWFVSWPLRRLSHPWRKSHLRLSLSPVSTTHTLPSLLFPLALPCPSPFFPSHLLLRVGLDVGAAVFSASLRAHTLPPPSLPLPPSQRLLWVWVLVAAAILSLVFTVAWRHAQANERDDLEAHCDEWAAFIQAKFNIMAANTRSISDFIRAYYLDNMREDLLDVPKFQRFTQATLVSTTELT